MIRLASMRCVLPGHPAPAEMLADCIVWEETGHGKLAKKRPPPPTPTPPQTPTPSRDETIERVMRDRGHEEVAGGTGSSSFSSSHPLSSCSQTLVNTIVARRSAFLPSRSAGQPTRLPGRPSHCRVLTYRNQPGRGFRSHSEASAAASAAASEAIKRLVAEKEVGAAAERDPCATS